MARILGVDIPNRKALRISLTAIYGTSTLLLKANKKAKLKYLMKDFEEHEAFENEIDAQ